MALNQPAASHSRPYAIHSATECERLEKQAALAGLPEHLRFIPVADGARILDAGCGSGSMARLLAAAHPHAQVIGVDIREDYVAFARDCAAREGLENVEFREGDIFDLPLEEASFDAVWSRYVLQWVRDPHLAIAEMRRVVAPGGTVACANFDGFAVSHWPEDAKLKPQLERVFPQLVDPFVGRKMGPLFIAAGFEAVEVECERDRLYTVIGAIDRQRRQNWEQQLAAAQPYIAKILAGEREAASFAQSFLHYQDRSDTCSYTVLYIVRGKRPATDGRRKRSEW